MDEFLSNIKNQIKQIEDNEKLIGELAVENNRTEADIILSIQENKNEIANEIKRNRPYLDILSNKSFDIDQLLDRILNDEIKDIESSRIVFEILDEVSIRNQKQKEKEIKAENENDNKTNDIEKSIDKMKDKPNSYMNRFFDGFKGGLGNGN